LANDKERLGAVDDRVGQFRFGRFKGQVFLAREKPNEWAPLQCAMVANRPAQNWIAFIKTSFLEFCLDSAGAERAPTAQGFKQNKGGEEAK